MLTIRQAQIDTMMLGTKENAAKLIALRLQETLPFFQHYSEPQLNHWVSMQIDYLEALKIQAKDNVDTIIDIIALHGEKFERCPDPSWALSILENAQESESIRAIMLQRANKAYLKETNLERKYE